VFQFVNEGEKAARHAAGSFHIGFQIEFELTAKEAAAWRKTWANGQPATNHNDDIRS
jgi:hypothetical protein